MPCYQVNLISVVFKIENIDLLAQAAKVLGWSFERNGDQVRVGNINVSLGLGKAFSVNQGSINQLKRQYSIQAVKLASKAKGWVLESWKEKDGTKSTVAVKF